MTTPPESCESISISYDNKVVSVLKGDNLLSALLEKGVDVSYGCRAGVCRACEVLNEQTQDTLLCCQTQVESSLVLNKYVPSPNVSVKVGRVFQHSDYCYQVELFGPVDHVFGLPIDIHVAEKKKLRTHVETDVTNSLMVSINPQKMPIHGEFIRSIKAGDDWIVNVAKSANVRAISRFQSVTLDRFPVFLILVNQAQAALATWQWYFQQESIKTVVVHTFEGSPEEESHSVKKWLTEQAASTFGFSRSQWIVQGSQLKEKEWLELSDVLQVNKSKVTYFP